MSIRTLVEINHDYTWRMTPEVLALVQRYLASGTREAAEALKQHGINVISQRHHSSDFYFDPAQVDGFGRVALKPGHEAGDHHAR